LCRQDSTTYGSGSGNKLQEMVGDFNDATRRQITTWQYTTTGNVFTVTDGGANNLTQYDYDATQTFVNGTHNTVYPGVVLNETSIIDPRFGVATDQYDINENRTHTDVDPFGRVIRATQYDGGGPSPVVAKTIIERSDLVAPNASPRFETKRKL